MERCESVLWLQQCSSNHSVRQGCRSILSLHQLQKQRPGALQKCPVAPAAIETASGSIAGVSCGSSINSNTVSECCGSVLWFQQQQKHRLGALWERSVAPATAETASGSVARASCGSSSSRNSVQEHRESVAGTFCGSNSVWDHCQNILWLQQPQK